MNIFVIIKDVNGPCGHGEPGEQYYHLNNPCWFSEKKDADKFIDDNDLWNCCSQCISEYKK